MLVQAIFDALTDRELSDEEPRGDGLRNSRTIGGGGTVTFTWDIASGLPVVLDDGNQYVYSAGLVSMKQSGSYLAAALGSTVATVDSPGNPRGPNQYDIQPGCPLTRRGSHLQAPSPPPRSYRSSSCCACP